MKRTRVKICGVTNTEDAVAAVDLGADALGLNFYPGSARFVEVEQAVTIARSLPAFVTLVGVFVDCDMSRVEEIRKAVGLDLLQFHGSEEPAYCNSVGSAYMKAIAATSAQEIAATAAQYPSAKAILLDTMAKGQFGGTGTRFDWDIIPAIAQPLVLAGGITPENVSSAVSSVKPWAIDVSGGVERDKGIKDAEKMKALILAIATADAEKS